MKRQPPVYWLSRALFLLFSVPGIAAMFAGMKWLDAVEWLEQRFGRAFVPPA